MNFEQYPRQKPGRKNYEVLNTDMARIIGKKTAGPANRRRWVAMLDKDRKAKRRNRKAEKIARASRQRNR